MIDPQDLSLPPVWPARSYRGTDFDLPQVKAEIGVYLIVDRIDRKLYVGSTRNLRQRMLTHRSRLGIRLGVMALRGGRFRFIVHQTFQNLPEAREVERQLLRQIPLSCLVNKHIFNGRKPYVPTGRPRGRPRGS